MADMPCAVISSTVIDLPEHRKAARDACLRQDFFPKMMEYQAPSPADPLRLSRELVDQADVYVLILGRRYGEVAANQDKSFTHLELDRANERGIPKLVLLMADDHPLLAADVEIGPGAERLRQLRERVRHEQAVNFFSSAEQLRALLIDGLSDMRKRLRPREATFHHIRHLVVPPEPYIAHPYTLLQTSEVIGRQRELNVLTNWVASSSIRFNSSSFMTFVAIGGIGKSAITWKWFNEIAPHEMKPLAGRVWWSFYESDARFDNFIARTLAYVSGLPLDHVNEMQASEQQQELLTALDQEPYLIVLDGLERLLLAYARPDAAYLADDDLDRRTANTVADALGLPQGAAASFTGQSRLRITADPRAGAFLRRLVTVGASRVLSTSRLYPADLQTVTGVSVQGATAYFVDGLSDDDAVNLWRAFGVSGGRGELVALFNTFGNYPLLIRALAGEVARFRSAPGDFGKWRQAHTEFDPFQLPIVQRKSHILQYALSGLTDTENRVLYTVAAFRAPATYDTLAALLVGSDKACPNEAALDVVLSDLEDRGLVGWDRKGNRYDLHPVVRGVAWSALDPHARQDIYQDFAAYFEAIPAATEDMIKTVDDMAGAFELYHTLVRLHRAGDAFKIFETRIFEAVDNISAYRESAELAELFITEPGLMELLKEQDDEAPGYLMLWLGLCYYLSGDPGRALNPLNKVGWTDEDEDHSTVLALKSMVLLQLGRLADAERSARESVNIMLFTQESVSTFIDFPLLALAMVLIRRGQYQEGRAWLSDSRTKVHDSSDLEEYFGPLGLLELGIAALNQDNVINARALAEQTALRAEELNRPLARIQARSLEAAVSEAFGDRERAHEILSNALVLARETRLADIEGRLLIQLGEWNVRDGNLIAAREYAADALHSAEHGQLKLLQADALNLLSMVERTAGNSREAAIAAAKAYRLAWCDGPPFSYELGLRQARENLAAVGEQESTGLPPFNSLTQMPESAIVPLNDNFLNPAALRVLYESPTSSPKIRAGALGALVGADEDSDRVWHDLLKATEDPAIGIRRVALKAIAKDNRDASSVLTRMLKTEQDPELRTQIITLLADVKHRSQQDHREDYRQDR